MPTFRITYTQEHPERARFTEEFEADHFYAAEWCVVFSDERGSPTKIIHANAIYAVELKPQTH